jgi:hypothetical protein
VPINQYPPEPGVQRCGNSYKKEISINGDLGNGFGKSFKHLVDPVLFGDGTPNVPFFLSQIHFNKELAVPFGFDERLREIKDVLKTNARYFSSNNAESLQALVLSAQNARSRAREKLPEGSSTLKPGHTEAPLLITEAVRIIRCLEYWTWRIILYGQAREAFGGQFAIQPGELPPLTPPEAELPPPPTGRGVARRLIERAAEKTKQQRTKPKQQSSSLPYILVAAAVGAVVIYKIRKS